MFIPNADTIVNRSQRLPREERNPQPSIPTVQTTVIARSALEVRAHLEVIGTCPRQSPGNPFKQLHQPLTVLGIEPRDMRDPPRQMGAEVRHAVTVLLAWPKSHAII
jgi:hypothetical protein